MSFRNGGFRSGARSVRPAQVFKKRNNISLINVLSNADAILVNEIVLRETGTIYSVKLDIHGEHLSGVAGDTQKVNLWIRCVPAVTALPDLTAAVELDTMNGFFVGTLNIADGDDTNPNSKLREKFRFRRKCDENSLVQVLAQSTALAGTGRTVRVASTFVAVIRMK